MKRVVISLVALAVMASAASADKLSENNSGTSAEGVLDCSGARAVTCGAVVSGVNGPGGTVALYGCTTLGYDGWSEVVYEICVSGDGNGDLTVDLEYPHADYNDLDLFVLGSCDPADCLGYDAGTSGYERVTIPAAPGIYYAVVDGWEEAGADGSPHHLSILCASGCVSPVEKTTWGALKSVYVGN